MNAMPVVARFDRDAPSAIVDTEQQPVRRRFFERLHA